MTSNNYYDVAIVGGGLAGLSSAIRLAKDGFSVVLFEKEEYPFHKVCGEYISLESFALLQSIDVPLQDWKLPIMDTLQLSAPNGNLLEQRLPLGGFGVSRYLIDHEMMQIARRCGVLVYDGTKVRDVHFSDDRFIVQTDSLTVYAKVCCGAFGKRSNVDVKWGRPFVQRKQNALNNFIGVKYHAQLDHPQNVIALHNFKGGYCGVAPIENGKVNICYLATAGPLREHNNRIRDMEEAVLFSNPLLKKVFQSATFLFDKPLTISQVSFERKEQVYDHLLLFGDSAGMITPLCGNGMSMALHGSSIATALILQFLKHEIDRNTLEKNYAAQWQKRFSGRLKAGRIIQQMFSNAQLINGIISALRPFPSVAKIIIRRTHG